MFGFSAPLQQKVKNTTTKYYFLYILLCIASKSLKSPGNNFSGIFGKFHYINLQVVLGKHSLHGENRSIFAQCKIPHLYVTVFHQTYKLYCLWQHRHDKVIFVRVLSFLKRFRYSDKASECHTRVQLNTHLVTISL